MFEQDSSHSFIQEKRQNIRTQTNQQRLQRIKKNKNIRKEKVIERRNQILQAEQNNKANITHHQKKEMQKQKNRIAAQNSRDRQKKYLEDLQQKIKGMQKQIQSQLCRRCKASLSQHSTSEGEPHQQSHLNMMGHIENESNRNQIKIFNEESQLQQIPLVRMRSQSDVQWGNIGKYFCIFLFVMAIALFSTSIETTEGLSSSSPVARILTQIHEQCKQPNVCFPQQHQTHMPSRKYVYKQNEDSWPFKTGTGQAVEECKNNYWQNYLQKAKKQVANPYDQNLLTCNNPNLVHIQTVYDKSAEGKWTFLITNPTVSNIFIEENGQHSLQDVNYLEGVYQLRAERVILTKVMGKNCLT